MKLADIPTRSGNWFTASGLTLAGNIPNTLPRLMPMKHASIFATDTVRDFFDEFR